MNQINMRNSNQVANNPFDQEKLIQQQNFSSDNQINKLPLNLFLTPAEYNKMLVTNGKHREKQTSHISEGYLSNLQFVNDSLFEKMQQTKAIAKMNIKYQPKSQKKSFDQCTCCCCQQFCQQCAIKGQNCNKFSSMQMRKAMSQIDEQIAMARQKSKLSFKTSSKKKQLNNDINFSRRTNSAASYKNTNKNYMVKGQNFTQNTPDISHLIIKSLVQFQSTKKKQAFMKKQKIHMQKAKQEFLKQMNEKIRQNNLKLLKSQRSLTKAKSASKTQISKSYWNKVKDEVIKNLKNDTYSATLKNQLKKYKLNVYAHDELPKKQVKFSKEQIKKLRQKHEQEAKKQIEEKKKEELQKKQKIKANLNILQKERLTHLQNIPLKPFKPTEEMINSAFKNIVQQKNIDQERYVLTSKSQRQTIKKQSRKNK